MDRQGLISSIAFPYDATREQNHAVILCLKSSKKPLAGAKVVFRLPEHSAVLYFSAIAYFDFAF